MLPSNSGISVYQLNVLQGLDFEKPILGKN